MLITLAYHRLSTAYIHVVTFLTSFPKKITALLKRLSRDRLCLCSFTCMHCAYVSCVPKAVVACFDPNTLHKAGQYLLCHSRIIQGFSVCSLNTADQGKYTYKVEWPQFILQLFASYCQNKNPMHEMSCGSRYLAFVRN